MAIHEDAAQAIAEVEAKNEVSKSSKEYKDNLENQVEFLKKELKKAGEVEKPATMRMLFATVPHFNDVDDMKIMLKFSKPAIKGEMGGEYSPPHNCILKPHEKVHEYPPDVYSPVAYPIAYDVLQNLETRYRKFGVVLLDLTTEKGKDYKEKELNAIKRGCRAYLKYVAEKEANMRAWRGEMREAQHSKDELPTESEEEFAFPEEYPHKMRGREVRNYLAGLK